MSKYYISINQFAEFSSATEASKKRIIKQQKIPNKLLIPWYQRAKGAIRKFFSDVKDYTPIDNAIKILEEKVPTNDRQKADKIASIQALELIKKLSLPKTLSVMNYELITADDKSLLINDVDIKVAPEIIIRAKYKNEVVYGAIKIHISKGKPFNHNQALYVSTLLHQFLVKKLAKRGERILPELCLCLDVFSERLVPAPPNIVKEMTEIKAVCNEVKMLWA